MSKIERLIEEIEQYIEDCKFYPLSNSKIIVNKDTILDLLSELKMRTPDEIKKCQNIIKNRDEILNKARADADAILSKAQAEANMVLNKAQTDSELMLRQTTIQTNELIDEHEIMQQAFAKANEIVQDATNQAQDLIDAATMDANNIRLGAIQYTDEMLEGVQQIVADMVEDSRQRYEGFYESLNATFGQIQANRDELVGQGEEESAETKGYENYEEYKGEDDSYQE